MQAWMMEADRVSELRMGVPIQSSELALCPPTLRKTQRMATADLFPDQKTIFFWKNGRDKKSKNKDSSRSFALLRMTILSE
jgi:hypothetical protein